MNENQIRELFRTHDVPLSRDDVWRVQQAFVIKHSALERLSAKLKITWDTPTIIRAQHDECVVLCRASRTDGIAEWSIGEAKIVPMVDTGRKNGTKVIYEPKDGALGNYQITPKQGAYPYAMAEKRAKDRVIIKLADLHGAYSEEEADDFSDRSLRVERDEVEDQRHLEGPQDQRQLPPPANDDASGDALPQEDASPQTREPLDLVAIFRERVMSFGTATELVKFRTNKKTVDWMKSLPEETQVELQKFAVAHMAVLKDAAKAKVIDEAIVRESAPIDAAQ